MNFNIDIERMILEGMPMSPSQGRKLQAAVEAELTRLLTTEGIPENWQAGRVVPHVSGSAIQVKPGTNPTKMGQQIAQGIYRGIKP